MLHDLDSTLEKMLRQELPPELFPTTGISFDTPEADSMPNKPAINLFLYDVRENMELRSGVGRYHRREGGAAICVRSAVRVDCSYLITFWPQTAESAGAKEEHKYLGLIMKVLLRDRKLPADVLQGELAGQEPPLHTVSLQSGHLNSMGDFWQAMGGKPKLAINYTVTISVPLSARGEVETLPLVTEPVLSSIEPLSSS